MARFNLPDIQFAQKSAKQIEEEAVAIYEQKMGIKLLEADPRRKLLQAMVALLTQQRVNIDYTAKQNLLAYASGSALDHMGTFTDTGRLPAEPAKTTMRYRLSTPTQQTITAGTRVTAGDGLFFATTKDVLIAGGQTTADVEAVCMVDGEIGNGYLPGQLTILVDPIQWVQSVENITTSEGGADQESDDAYAERIRQAPESFSVAGPGDAYAYWAKTASPLIVDVSVDSPMPACVEIRPLLQNGAIPGAELLQAVYAICNDRKVRPLTDRVQVLAPEVVQYDIELTYWINTADSSMAAAIQSNVQRAVTEYQTWQRSKLGRSIDPSELIARIKNAGAKRVTVTAPTYQALEKYQVALSGATTAAYGGLEDG